MKKIFVNIMVVMMIMLSAACTQTAATGAEQELPDIASGQEAGEETTVETRISTDGHTVVLGILVSQDKEHVMIKTNDDYELDFKLMPETVIYTGEAAALLPGDEIAVVFDGNLNGMNTEGVKVITISISKEETD